MKKIHRKFTLFTALCLTLQLFCITGSAISSDRFEFIEIEYTGEIYDAGKMSEGLIKTCAEGYLSGYIDAEGKTVIDFVFDYAGNFSGGLAPANVRYGKKGYIDKTGKFVIPPQFDEAAEFSDGLALVRKDDMTGFIDTTGKFVDIVPEGYVPVSSFSDGVFWVEDADGLRGLASADKQVIIPCRYEWTSEFSDGVCWVSSDTGDDFNHIKMGLIDAQANVLIEEGIYTDASDFCEGYSWVKEAGQKGIYLIDKSGEKLKRVIDGMMPFDFSGGISVSMGSDLLSVMHKNGNYIYSTSAYVPVYYGALNEGTLLVRDTKTSKYYIMRDTAYAPKEPQTYEHNFSYIEQPEVKSDFEIILKVDCPRAIVDGQVRDIDPDNALVSASIVNSRMLLPMRFIVENVPGWSVSWDYLTNCALIRNDNCSVLISDAVVAAEVVEYIEKDRSYVLYKKQLDQPALTMHDRLFLPVRAMGELMGANVLWDESGIAILSNTRTEISQDEIRQIHDILSVE